MPGRFPLVTDENIPGPLIEGLKVRGWDVALIIDVFGQRSVDERVFTHAAEQGRVLLTTDIDCLVIASRWLDEGRPFRLIYCVLPASVHETGSRPAYGHEQEDGSWYDRGRLQRQDV